MALDPHPALLALKDPYDPIANAPYRVHDMTLYKGHYYLYFGVTPVLVLFWPVAALTGIYLNEPFAVALFCSAAVWVGMGLILAVRRRHFPEAPALALFAGWACLAFATPILQLVEGPQFYQVPISCAILLLAVMLALVYRSLHATRSPLPWMAAAGLAYGLAIGARPNYLVCAAVLLIPVAVYAQKQSEGLSGGLRAFIKAAAITFFPAAVCGVGILAFNYVRFGSASEFGMHYQLAGERFTALKQMSPSFMVPHVLYYLFNGGFWQSYFPFFAESTGQPYGFLRYLPWSWLILAALIWPASRASAEGKGYYPLVWAIAGAAVLNLAFLSCFFGTTARYPGDFANAALILAGIGALALGQRLYQAGFRTVFRGVAGGLALVSLYFSLTVFVAGFTRHALFFSLYRAANWPAFAWQRAHGENFGGLRLDLVLPDKTPELAEPLLETGIQSDARDWLQITYLPGNKARLSWFHAGTGLFSGHDFRIPSDRRVAVEVHCGSLLPPYESPVFSDWSRAEYGMEKRSLRILVNGSEVLGMALDCYDSSPANVTVGKLAWFSGGMKQVFTGTIAAVSRLPLAKPVLPSASFAAAAPLELTLYLPGSTPSAVEPLLVTGTGQQSDLFYCAYDGHSHVSFGVDHYGGGGPRSEPLAYDPLVPHKVVVWMGSIAPSSPGDESERNRNRLVVVFDGRVALNTSQVFFPGSPQSVSVGSNPFGSTVAREEFMGHVLSIRQLQMSDLPAFDRKGAYGSVDMTVEFPLGALGTQEPLVVSGVTGAGDLVYLRYVDPQHVLFGFDHWGIGGTVGKPVPVDYRTNHRLKVLFQSLFPPGSPGNMSDLVLVELDGKTALAAHWPCHPTRSEQITIGTNPIGGSTCGPAFTGRILDVTRSLVRQP